MRDKQTWIVIWIVFALAGLAWLQAPEFLAMIGNYDGGGIWGFPHYLKIHRRDYVTALAICGVLLVIQLRGAVIGFDRFMRIAWLLVVVYAIWAVERKDWMSGIPSEITVNSGSYSSWPVKLEVEVTNR